MRSPCSPDGRERMASPAGLFSEEINSPVRSIKSSKKNMTSFDFYQNPVLKASNMVSKTQKDNSNAEKVGGQLGVRKKLAGKTPKMTPEQINVYNRINR